MPSNPSDESEDIRSTLFDLMSAYGEVETLTALAVVAQQLGCTVAPLLRNAALLEGTVRELRGMLMGRSA